MLSCKFYGVSRTCVAQVVRRGTLSGLKTTHEIRLISNDYVGLNVGGKIYQTSRSTLTRYPSSFFVALMESDVPSAKDDQGNYLIDRDGEIFRHVLNFLRSGELVLPERFNELPLLEREADFFFLQELKMLITQRLPTCEAMGVRLMFDDGKVFNTKREILMREDNSFFTKMLNGEIEVARDPQGNYIMDRDGRLFHHIMSYLRDGGIFNALHPDELDSLEIDAEYFKLEVLAAHIQSIKFMQQKIYYVYNPPPLHFYYCVNGPCVAYTVATCDQYTSVYRDESTSSLSRESLFSKEYAIIDSAQSGLVNMEKIKCNGPASLRDVMFFLKRNVGQHNILQHHLNANCTRLELDP